MNKNIEKIDAVLSGNYQCEFQENQQTVDDIEKLANEQAIIGK